MKKFIIIITILSAAFNCMSQINPEAVKSDIKSSLRPNSFIPFNMIGNVPTYSNVKISTDFKNNNASGDFSLNLRKGYTSEHYFSLQFQQSISEDANEFTPFDLSGLSNGTTVRLGYQYHHWNPELNEEQFQKFDAIRNEFARNKGITDKNAIRAINYSDLDKKSKLQLAGLFKPHLLLNFKYSVNNNKMGYINDVSNIDIISQYKLNQQVTASVGSIFGSRRNQSLYVSYNFVSLYSDASDPVDLVIPLNNSNISFIEKDVVIGKPLLSHKSLLQATYRIMAYSREGNPIVGFAPQLEYLTNDKVLAFQLPVYFIPGRNGKEITGLTGGIRFGYSAILKNGGSNYFKDNLRIGLVLSVPFSQIGNL